jgi:Ca2+-binding EF-hand superfamily protein
MRSACAIGFGLAILLACGTARAQQDRPKAKPVSPPDSSKAAAAPCAGRLGALDTNKDGKIEKAEFKGSKKLFVWIDADHNGVLTRPEATRAALAVIGGLVLAEKKHAYQAMDKNKDGKIQEAEFKGPKAGFAWLDANHDGVITRAEGNRALRATVRRAMMVAGLKAMDKDKDGMITATEYKGPKPGFARLDVNKDSRIGPGEMARLFRLPLSRQHVAAAKPAAAPATEPAKPMKPASTAAVAARSATMTPATPVKPASTTTAAAAVRQATGPLVALIRNVMALDANKDGKVVKAEFMKACATRYDRIDSNHDGSVTAAEVQAVLAKHQ